MHLRVAHGAKRGQLQLWGCRRLRPPLQRRLLGRSPPGLLAPSGGAGRGTAAVEDLGAVGQQRGPHLPPLLEAARVGDAEAPAVAAASGLAAVRVGRLLLPAAGAVGGGGDLVGSGGGRRRGRRFLVLLLAGQRLPPGRRSAALDASGGGGGGRGAVRHLGLLRGERERERAGSRAGSRAHRHPARRDSPPLGKALGAAEGGGDASFPARGSRAVPNGTRESPTRAALLGKLCPSPREPLGREGQLLPRQPGGRGREDFALCPWLSPGERL